MPVNFSGTAAGGYGQRSEPQCAGCRMAMGGEQTMGQTFSN